MYCTTVGSMPIRIHPVVAVTLLVTAILVFTYIRIRFTPSLRDTLSQKWSERPYDSTGNASGTLISVDELYEVAQTGDILLMSGTSFNEKVVKWWTGAPVSHVGLIVKEDHPGPTDTDTLFMWEADVGQGSVDGSRLIPLRQKLRMYKGEHTAIYIPLLSNWKRPVPVIGPEGMEMLRKYVHTTHKPMDRLFTRYFFGSTSSASTVYCSELACNTLQVAGVMRGEEAALSPADWFPTGMNAGDTRAGRMLQMPYSYRPWYILSF